MRKELWRACARAQHLVKNVELEIVSWLHNGAVLLSTRRILTILVSTENLPGAQASGVTQAVARPPSQLVWAISEDRFARYVLPRYYQFRQALTSHYGRRIHANDSKVRTRLDNVSPISHVAERKSRNHDF